MFLEAFMLSAAVLMVVVTVILIFMFILEEVIDRHERKRGD
jgi:hypothetical protein